MTSDLPMGAHRTPIQGEPKDLDPDWSPEDESEGAAKSSPRESLSTRVLQMARSAGAGTWKDAAGTPHVSLPIGRHWEHHPLKSDAESQVGRWLTQLFYQREGRALPSNVKKDVLETFIAGALASQVEFPTGRRVVRLGDHVYLDLCNAEWEVVDVSPEGWRICKAEEVPVRFTRAPSMLSLPRPVEGGLVTDLRPFFNCDEEGFKLISAWILVALSGAREYPILVFGGEAGSAKSTATRIARALVDPNEAPLRKTPKEERDLFISAKNAYVLTFDNLSTPPGWLADALCAIALDTGYACRSLYTDTGETIFRVACPIILNGITDQLSRADLADRAFGVTLHRIPAEQMRPKDELEAAFNAARPSVLGALLDAVASALARLPEVKLDRYPRMAQTAKFMAAAEPALGWEHGTFAALADRARAFVAGSVTEGDPLLQALQDLIRTNGGAWTFCGSATELRNMIAGNQPVPLPKNWPPAPNKLTERLRRLAPQLRELGWQINPDGRDGTKKNGRVLFLSFGESTTLPEEKNQPSEPPDRPEMRQ